MKNNKFLFLAFISTRIAHFIIAVTSYMFIHNEVGAGSSYWRGIIPDKSIFIRVWQRWDSNFYQSILEKGYKEFAEGVYDTAFFPLYPFLGKIVNVLVGNAPVSLLIISNLSLFLAMYYMFNIVKEDYGEAIAKKSVWFLLAYPFAFFFTGIYTESLFLALLTGSVYYMRKNNIFMLSLFSFLLPLSRAVGVVVIPVVFYYLYKKHLLKNFFVLILPMLALIGYYLYSAHVGQTFSESSFLGWKRYYTFPWTTIIKHFERITSGDFSVIFIYNLVLSFVFLGTIVWSIKEGMKLEYIIIMLVLVFMPLCSNQLKSFVRYSVVVFPTFILLAQKIDERIFLALGFSLQGLMLGLYSNWVYIA